MQATEKPAKLIVYEVEADGVVIERYSEAAAHRFADEQRKLGKSVSVRPKPDRK